MLKYATISEDGKYRYQLSRIWEPSKERITFIMLNPSTANEHKDDATIRRLIAFCKLWGYGGFSVYNLFAYRATNPDVMWQAHKDGEDIIGPKNDEWLELVAASDCKVVFAWGGNGHILNRALTVSIFFKQAYCIETSGHGFPKHPLYLKADSKLNLVHLDAEGKNFIIPTAQHQRPMPAMLVLEDGGMKVKLQSAS
jgi:hypothetical protein